MKVTRLPVDSGLSGWNEVLPKAGSPNILEKNISTDYLVIGAGFAGLSAAHRLRQLNASDGIVVIDACRVGEGPAGRNSGFMIDLPHDLSSDNYSGGAQSDKDEINLNRTAINFARNMAHEYELGDDVFNECGKINVAATTKGAQHLHNYEKHLSALNEPFSNLSHSQMCDLTGSDYYQCGLFTPGAVLLQPAAYVRGIADKLSRKVSLYENTPAVEIFNKNNLYTVQTPKANITANKVILAVNGHIESFGLFKKRLMHIILYASMTSNLTASQQRTLKGESSWNLIPSDPLGTTLRRINGEKFGGNRIVVRNYATYNPSMEISPSQLHSVVKKHNQSFLDRFPMLKDVNMEFQWAGRLCLSRNNVPAFGEIEEGLFSAACQNGLGATKGTLSGMLTAELAAGCDSNLLQHYLNQKTPSKLPPEPFMSMGAKSILKIKQLKAGREL